ncbi:MAG: DUF2752 domain-containing protein [Acidimicrobiia bacterium]
MNTVTAARRLPASVAPLAVGAAAVAGCAFVAMNDPSHARLWVCPFKAMTGLPCPGCGATRAAYQLMQGNIGAAIQFNAVAVFLVFPLLIALYVLWALPRLGGPQLVKLRMPTWAAWTLLAITLTWWTVRLLPFEPFLGLRV